MITSPLSASQQRRRRVSDWVAAAVLLLTLGSLVLAQWVDSTKTVFTLVVADVPVVGAVVVLAVGLALLAVRLPSRRSITLTVLFTLWLGLAWVNPLGEAGLNFLLLGSIAFGLTIAAALAPARWSGWIVVCIGTVFIWLNWLALAMNYATVGARMPRAATWGSAEWWTDVVEELPQVPPPTGWVGGWVADRISGRVSDFTEIGLSGNANGTGNAVVCALAFVMPFVVAQTRCLPRRRDRGLALGATVMICVLPGLVLLRALDARSALGAALLGMAVLLIPRRWLSTRPAAIVGAALPLVMLIPFLLARTFGLSLSGRSCVWADWWTAVGGSPIWGVGPPGEFPGGVSGQSCDVPVWGHAHNELLHAWTVSGILGLVVAFGTFGWLGWLAVRHHDRDGRVLLSVMVAATVIMSVEVLSNASGWRWYGFATFMIISARSVALFSQDPAADHALLSSDGPTGRPELGLASTSQPVPGQ